MLQMLSDRAVLVSPLPICTADEARVLGIRLDDGTWRRLRKGVYVDRAKYAELPPWERYAVRVHGYLRTHPDAILCLESAAVFHGLPSFGETRYIHVYDPTGRRSQRYGDVRVHTSDDLRSVERVGAALVTSLCDTVVDLARAVSLADAVAIVDAATAVAQGGPLTLEVLRSRADAQPDRRGRARMQWVWENANGLSESPAESVSRVVIGWIGYEEPELQRELRYDGHRDRCDFYFPDSRAIGECDGWGKYMMKEAEQGATRLADEKRREDRLRRHRHPFARWEPRDAWHFERLGATLDAAGVPRVRQPQPHLLATLRIRPRAIPPRTSPSAKPTLRQ